MRRAELGARVLLYGVAAAFGLWHVARLQAPALGPLRLAALAGVALAPALVATRLGRRAAWPALVVAVVVGIGAAVSVWPTPHDPVGTGGYAGRLVGGVRDGAAEWLDVTLPYDWARHPDIRGLVLLVTFGLLLVLAFALVSRRPRPLLAVLAAGVPFAVVSTVYSLPAVGLRAALFLAFTLAVLGLGDRGPGVAATRTLRGGVLLGLPVVALASAVAVLPGVPRGELFGWREWRLGTPPPAVDLSYVWDQSYTGLRWPAVATEVLQISAPRGGYWRAATLDRFDGVSWTSQLEDVRGVAAGASVAVPRDGAKAGRVVRARVTVQGIAERHLVSAGQPVSYTLPAGIAGYAAGSGVVQTVDPPARRARYEVEYVLPDPTPAALQGAGTAYPPAVARADLVAFRDAAVPAFGTAGREPAVERLLADAGDPGTRGWLGAYRRARVVTAGAATPYDAVVRLERWFRTHFRYDESVSLAGAAGPPLPGWILHGRGGYCQIFSGSMASLVRLLGIPARVAEGFTPGRYDRARHIFRVSDHDAHAWVEVYFPGSGWIPFDPTPGRRLASASSTSSLGALGLAAIAAGIRAAGTGLSDPGHGGGGSRGGRQTRPPAAAPARTRGGGRDDGPSALLLAPLGLAALFALLAAAKAAVRLRRHRTHDPRRRAAACRADLAAFALDQRVDLADALTHRELAERVGRDFAVDATRWALAADAARFGPAARSQAASAELVRETRRMRRAMRRGLSRRSRLAGALSLRSFVRLAR